VAGQEEAAERVEMATKVGVTVTVDEARSTKAGWRIIKKTKMHYQHKLLAVYIYIAPPPGIHQKQALAAICALGLDMLCRLRQY
jgi:hypothetical protein